MISQEVLENSANTFVENVKSRKFSIKFTHINK